MRSLDKDFAKIIGLEAISGIYGLAATQALADRDYEGLILAGSFSLGTLLLSYLFANKIIKEDYFR